MSATSAPGSPSSSSTSKKSASAPGHANLTEWVKTHKGEAAAIAGLGAGGVYLLATRGGSSSSDGTDAADTASQDSAGYTVPAGADGDDGGGGGYYDGSDAYSDTSGLVDSLNSALSTLYTGEQDLGAAIATESTTNAKAQKKATKTSKTTNRLLRKLIRQSPKKAGPAHKKTQAHKPAPHQVSGHTKTGNLGGGGTTRHKKKKH